MIKGRLGRIIAVFAARIDGKVGMDHHDDPRQTAVYYYASMLTSVRRQHMPDKLLYFAARTWARRVPESLTSWASATISRLPSNRSTT